MSRFIERLFLPMLAASFITISAPSLTAAQEHVVSPKELQNDARLERMLATPEGRQALNKAGVDYATVEKGVRTLSDAEVARLAARADKAQANFAAGSITLPELLIILVAIIVIIVIVAAI